ncbi:hypothetical protein D3C80_813130 [compost metagenome]
MRAKAVFQMIRSSVDQTTKVPVSPQFCPASRQSLGTALTSGSGISVMFWEMISFKSR